MITLFYRLFCHARQTQLGIIEALGQNMSQITVKAVKNQNCLKWVLLAITWTLGGKVNFGISYITNGTQNPNQQIFLITVVKMICRH